MLKHFNIKKIGFNAARIVLAHKRSFIALLVGVVAFSVIGHKVAQAQTPAITVCIKNNGAMYMIGQGFRRADCRRNDQLITWNVGGLPGPQGVQGIPGPTGPVGPQGEAGTSAGGAIDKSRVYQKIAGETYNLHSNRGFHVIEVFCDDANDIMLTSWYETFSGSYNIGIESNQHEFRPSGIDSWRLGFRLEIDPDLEIIVPADVNVIITCLRAD